jgi:hypothetical protein
MPSCEFFYGKIFANLTAALVVSTYSAENLRIGDTLYDYVGLSDLNRWIKLAINLFIGYLGVQAVERTVPGSVGKYAAFLALSIWFGQIVKPFIDDQADKRTLLHLLMLKIGMCVGMMALGVLDLTNTVTVFPYMGAGFLGMAIAAYAFYIFSPPDPSHKPFDVVNGALVAAFAAYTAYDVHILKDKAKNCDKIHRHLEHGPDYPKEVMDLYLDIFNVMLRPLHGAVKKH